MTPEEQRAKLEAERAASQEKERDLRADLREALGLSRERISDQEVQTRTGSPHADFEFAKKLARGERIREIGSGSMQAQDVVDAAVHLHRATRPAPDHPLGEAYEKWFTARFGHFPYTEACPPEPSQPFQKSDVETEQSQRAEAEAEREREQEAQRKVEQEQRQKR